jgi:putative nucleotidyltransferase with HDIG domain
MLRCTMNDFDFPWNRQRLDAKLPVAVQEVVRLINEPRTSVARLVAAVAKHQVLAESVLRKANVSTYGLPGRVKNLNSAVVVLGFDALKETSRSVLAATTGRKMTHSIIKLQGLWEHSIGCAIVARTLAKRSGKCNPDDAFVAGLLHDVGAFFSPNLDRGGVVASALPGALPFASPVLEGMTRFGHAHLGADKAEEWSLAEDIVEAIRFHHLPRLAATNVHLTAVVHTAEFLCHRLQVGRAEFEHADYFDNEMLIKLNVPMCSSMDALAAMFEGVNKDILPHAASLREAAMELKNAVIDTLDRMAEVQRLMVALHYYEGLSAEEIGQLMETPASTVNAYLSGSIAQLRSALQIQVLSEGSRHNEIP